ncbi:MAG: PQQ-binding-like beta-propeller repeat protein [Planctomycetaceae bacterium]
MIHFLTRPHPILVWLSLIYWLTPLTLQADPGGDQERLHPPPRDTLDTETESLPPELFQQRQALLPLLYRDRQHEAIYKEIRRAFIAGRTVEGLQLLQQLFDADEDSFYWPTQSPTPISIRGAAQELFFQQSPAEWLLYAKLNEPAATALLEEAQSSHDTKLYHELVNRFAFTSAGWEGRRFLIYHALDRHRFHEAYHHLSQMLGSEIHRDRLTASDFTLYNFLKDQVQSDSWNESYSNQHPLRTAMLEDSTTRDYPVLQISQSNFDSRYFSPVSHSDLRTVWQDITPPYLKAVWSASHVEADSQLLDQTMEYWEQEQAGELKPAAVGWKPIVVGETVYVRSYDTINAYNLKTGEELWQYSCQSRFSPLLENFRPHSRLHSRTQFSQLTSELNLEQILVGNNLLGTLTHDKSRLYLIDEVELEAMKTPVPASVISISDGVNDEAETRRRTNRLIALPLLQEQSVENKPVKASWSLGGLTHQTDPRQNNVLSGHFILGPPLVHGNELYLLTEHKQQINLVALEAESGSLLWSQGIGWVEFLIDQDMNRTYRAATPILAHNLLLCPCLTGTLVAVDRSSGSLRWVYDYREPGDSQQQRHWSRRSKGNRGHIGFDDFPLVHDDRILYLPHQSEHLHCIDLTTGKTLWKQLRKDADYIGTLDDKLAFVVGRKSCRGLSLRNGRELWSSRLGTPSGMGTRAGSVYLLPLQSGQVASIEIQTGAYSGLSHLHNRVDTPDVNATTTALFNSNEEVEAETEQAPQVQWSPGNLIANQDYIISAGPRGITIFPQAGSQVYQSDSSGNSTEVELTVATEEESAKPRDAYHHLRRAELSLILDQLEEAQQSLELSLQQGEALTSEDRNKAQHLLREVLFARLRSEPSNRESHSRLLQQFAQTKAEEGRLLMEEAEFQLLNGNHKEAWQNVIALAEYDLNLPLMDLTDATLTITPRSWIPLMRKRLLATGGNSFKHLFELQCQRYLARAMEETDSDRLEVLLVLFGNGEETAEAKLQLAQQYFTDGKYHLAEQLWMSVREFPNQQYARVASDNLIQLWKQFDQYQLAAAEIERSRALQNYDNADSDAMLRLCLRQIQKQDSPVTRIRISEERWSDEGAELMGYRSALQSDTPTPFTLLTKGSGHTGKLTLLDRLSGNILEPIDVPTGTLSHQLSSNQLFGSQLCLGGSNTAIGLSLLTRKAVWEVSPDTGLRRDSLSVLTINSDYTILRSRHQIAVVDTGTGKILWQRDEVSPAGNRLNTGQTGVMGDAEALVMFEDHLNYTVFTTRTGEELRQGQFTFDPSERHYIFGRKIFYFEPEGEASSVCLYDPLRNRYVFKREVDRPVFSSRTSDEKLALLSPVENSQDENRMLLEIIDPEAETHLLKYELNEEEAQRLSFLRVFDDRDHYYVNLQQHDNNALDLPGSTILRVILYSTT